MEYLKLAKQTAFMLFCITLSHLELNAQTKLDIYVKQGIESNLALQQKHTSYRQSIEQLQEARGMFFPSISFNARYTVARGGRVIEFPVGDLLNDAYATLNVLSEIHDLRDPATGQLINFPMLENQEFQFYRPREHDTKLELVQPIFNPQIYYNHKARQNLSEVKKADADAYKRHLVAEIKTAYYNYLKALGILRLVENTITLLEENIRVNERLYSNDLITIDNVYRSKAELAKINQQYAEARRMEKSVAAYLNFLVNKPPDTPIETDDNKAIPEYIVSYEDATNNALSQREELDIIQSYSLAANNKLSAIQSTRLPTITGWANYGFQGEKYKFTSDHDYILASVILRWDIFTGRQNSSRIQQAKLDLLQLEQKEKEVEKTIKLEVINTWYALEAAGKSIEAARAQAKAANKAFDVVKRQFEEGQTPLIEFIDSRSTMTNAEENLIIAIYDYMISYAEYELAAGLYSF